MEKQIWEKTFREINTFNESYDEAEKRHEEELKTATTSGAMRIAERLTKLAKRRDEHKAAVKAAISSGENVPAKVLAEYKDLYFSEHEKIALEKGYKKQGKYYELEKGSYTHQIWFMNGYNSIRMRAWITGQFDTNTYKSGVFDAEKLTLSEFKKLLEFFLDN